MILSHSPVSETFRERIEAALAGAYGIQVEALDRLHAGTATDNLQVRATDGQEWFVKLHATHSELDAAGEAIALAEFVRGGGRSEERRVGKEWRGGGREGGGTRESDAGARW